MKDSGLNKAVKWAYNKGYKVLEDGTLLKLDGKPRNLQLDTRGYYKSTVKIEGKYYQLYVHKFVAYQKFGEEALREGIQVRHLDGDSLNNAYSNIAIGSASDNMMDMPKSIRKKKAAHAAKYMRALSDGQVKQFRKDRENGMTLNQLAKKYGIAKSTASYIVNGKTYSSVEQ